MSNSLAIAAVTATLRNLLFQGVNTDLAGTDITTRPLDKARGNTTGNQLNLFLYHTTVDAAWRNMDMPRQIKPGEAGAPPLPLILYYLITAYGENDDDTISHRILGRAMSVLHDHPLLGEDEIRTALANNDLHQQVERIRITTQPMSLEEMSKLWTTFQTQYRISVAYQASVVLIESRLPVRAPLPVLKRGQDDRGADTTAGPLPSIDSVRPDVLPPDSQPAARLGDDVLVKGQNLAGDSLVVRLSNPHLPAPIEVAPLPERTADQLRIHLPGPDEDPAALDTWAPGFYTAALVVQRPDIPAWTTSEVPFALAPTIAVAPISAPAGALTLTVRCSPRLRDRQRVLLLFGERQVAPATLVTPADTTQPTTLTFQLNLSAADTGSYVVRLRVDGVDSLPIVRSGPPPRLDFDPKQTVKIL